MPDKFSYDALFAANAPEVPPGKTRHARYDFAVAYPNPDTLPLDGLADAVRAVLSREGRDLAYVEKYGSKFLTAITLRWPTASAATPKPSPARSRCFRGITKGALTSAAAPLS